jgi:flagellar protein FlbD
LSQDRRDPPAGKAGLSADKGHERASFMIRLTRLNHTPVVLNADLIEHIEITPDTVITLTTGQKLVVLESSDEVIERIVEFRRSISLNSIRCPLAPVAANGGSEESG